LDCDFAEGASTGDVSQISLQFVLGADWSSRLIAWWGQGYRGFSHVDGVLSDGSLAGARSDAIGGKPPGCQIRPPNYEVWKRRMIMTLKTTDAIAENWEQFFRNGIGTPYDKEDILGFIIGKPLSTEGHWICSAWQTDNLETQNLLPSMYLPPQQVTPNTLADICSATGWLVTTDSSA
jgi:hypothetical protein